MYQIETDLHGYLPSVKDRARELLVDVLRIKPKHTRASEPANLVSYTSYFWTCLKRFFFFK